MSIYIDSTGSFGRDFNWIFFYFVQYEYFFENGEPPKVCEQVEVTTGAVPKAQTDLLLDNVAKIECKWSAS